MNEALARPIDAAAERAARTSSARPPPSAIRGARELDRLWARGREFLGTELAIMGGAMTWVSERNLVAAISNAGGFGVIASRLDVARPARRRDRRHRAR